MASSPPRPPQSPAGDPCRTDSNDRDGSRSPHPHLPGSPEHHLAIIPDSTPTSQSKKRPSDPPSPATADDQCTRTNGKTWRCSRRRIPDKCFCEKHYKANLSWRQSTKNHPSSSKVVTEVPDSLEAVPINSIPKTDTTSVAVRSCEVGEVWAMPDDSGLPRAYARIDRFIPEPGLAVLTPLVHHPVSDEEMEWAENGLSVACGTFRAFSNSMVVKEIASLSHQVSFSDAGEGKLKSFFKIFPRLGEVWAVYDDLERGSGYHLVEIVSGFMENGGVTAARLVAVDGSACMYRRELHNRYQLLRSFGKEELLWFSHRVMAIREGDDDGIRGLWKVIS